MANSATGLKTSMPGGVVSIVDADQPLVERRQGEMAFVEQRGVEPLLAKRDDEASYITVTDRLADGGCLASARRFVPAP